MVRLRVKEVAQAKGYNMSSLSRATDIGLNTIRRLWNHPEQGANIQTLARIAEVLEVSIDQLTEIVPD